MKKLDIDEKIYMEAVLTKLQPTNLSHYRTICRWFSKTFSTPLKTVETYPMDYILQHWYEDRLDQREHNDVFDHAIERYVPEMIEEDEAELEEYLKDLEQEQAENLRLKEKRNKKQSLGKSGPTNPIPDQTILFEPEEEP